MTAFIWTILIMMGLSAIGKLIWLVNHDLPVRKPTHEALDVAIIAAFLVWGGILLNG